MSLVVESIARFVFLTMLIIYVLGWVSKIKLTHFKGQHWGIVVAIQVGLGPTVLKSYVGLIPLCLLVTTLVLLLTLLLRLVDD